MRAVLLVALVACGSESPHAATPETSSVVPSDAAIADATAVDAPADAAFEVTRGAPPELPLACFSNEQGKGWIEVNVDRASLRGTLYRLTTGPAPQRRIEVIARLRGDVTELVFDRYGEGDATTIRNRRVRRPAGERLVRGKSIVGRLVTSDGRTRLFLDGEVDLVTGAHPQLDADRAVPCTAKRGR